MMILEVGLFFQGYFSVLFSVLRTYPRETLAFKCKLVALIQLSRLDEALTLIKKTPLHHMG